MGDDDDRPVLASQAVDAAGDDAERVDVQAGVGLVEDGEPGIEHRHLEDLVALLLAAGEPFVDRAAGEALVHLHQLHLLLGQRKEVHRVQLLLATALAERVERGPQEIQITDAGDLHRVLEGHEDAGHRTLLGREGEQVPPLVEDLAFGHLVGLAPGEDLGEGALARPVGAHDGVHLARVDLQVDAAENPLVADLGVQVLDAQHGRHAMLPSRLTLRSFCASTANSIGSSLNTCRQKPLTIIETASSWEMPRCVQSKSWSSPIFEAEASCSTCEEGFFTSIYGMVWAPQRLPCSS